MTRRNLDERNQGYWDRVTRSSSWVRLAKVVGALRRKRARSLSAAEFREYTAGPRGREMDRGYHEEFICYWIAFNALYGRPLEEGPDNPEWFIAKICEIDRDKAIVRSLRRVARQADVLLGQEFLIEDYWTHGVSPLVKRRVREDPVKAAKLLEEENTHDYVHLLMRRLRVLRNQVFHGCSTYRSVKQTASILPAVEVLRELVPTFVRVMRAHGERDTWPRIPFPRHGSPQWRRLGRRSGSGLP